MSLNVRKPLTQTYKQFLFSCSSHQSSLFERTRESTKQQHIRSANQWLITQTHCTEDVRHCCISLSHCISLQPASHNGHSRSTHPDQSCDEVQEGDGNAVLALRLLYAHQQVSIAPSIHSVCTVKQARGFTAQIVQLGHEWEMPDAQIA